ncbi:hypothetical protein SPRG_21333 [Saprolegnia parasitica CBS 223.65]|uniref:TUG ubiquitin-like domain-containing protein n=1 Tax=Saprolegnia parasitica (strain CBS 223.65) TaxID=695850 RepID=A0A067C3Y0_SAPPC|nr:hypothetical protein SPRG_21333 [Saprolegnia parasitica CBS 223.65]KDO21241.1 hypothetical protein SPRG_21333 [Saprolegnia parasitica CBS 223.65]|eukprot:XP_012208081.1 hypothetical protein SPRG_21333 [Saprolegnia parasitica CBS 223.65]
MSLTVLLDGHRKKVPVTAGTSMSDVLRKACELHDVDADRHELRHKHAVVDLSLPFRLTGISSNATLDMAAKKAARTTRCSHTLAAILAQLQIHLSPECDSLNFMRRDIRGPELDTLTLQALGLVSGSGMFRVQSSATSTVAPPPRVVAAPAPSPPHVATSMPVAAPVTPAIAPMAAVPEPVVSAPSPLPSTPFDAIQRVRSSNFDAVSSTVPKVRSIRSSNPKFVDAVGRHAGGIEFLLACGFAVDGDMLHLASESSDVLQNALRVLHDEADDLRIDLSARPQVQVPSSLPAPAFDAYQPLITRMQAQPRGASITERRLDDLKKKQDALLASSTPARQTRILFPHELQHATLAAPTTGGKSDAQLLAQALKARQDAAEKSQSFRTLAMRELDDLQRRSVYQEAVLRIRFPDKGTFPST